MASSQRALQKAWQHWLGLLTQADSTVQVEAAVHDHLPGDWQHNGLRIDAHINWFILQGTVVGHLHGQQVQVPGGGWICLAPDTPIHFRCQEPSKPLHMLRFRLRLEQNKKPCPVPNDSFILTDARPVRALASQVMTIADADDPLSDQQRRGLLLALYAEAARVACRPQRAVRGLSDEQLQISDELIAQYLPDAVPPAALAAAVSMKADTFARAFKRSRGMSPRAWIAGRRIQHAAELLLMPYATVTAVADDCGYADLFHFSKQFSQVMGCSPRVWQQRHHQRL